MTEPADEAVTPDGTVSITVREKRDGEFVVTDEREGENATTNGMHSYLAACLLHRDASGFPDRPAELAVGSGNDTFGSSNTQLNDELGRVSLSDSTRSGTTTQLTAQIETDEFVGETIRELGVVSGLRLFNIRQVSPPIDKHSQMQLTIQVEWSFADDSS